MFDDDKFQDDDDEKTTYDSDNNDGEDNESFEDDFRAYESHISIVGRYWYNKNKDGLSITRTDSYIMGAFALLVKKRYGNIIRKDNLYVKTFSEDLVNFLSGLERGTLIRVSGDLEQYKNQLYINAKAITRVEEPEETRSAFLAEMYQKKRRENGNLDVDEGVGKIMQDFMQSIDKINTTLEKSGISCPTDGSTPLSISLKENADDPDAEKHLFQKHTDKIHNTTFRKLTPESGDIVSELLSPNGSPKSPVQDIPRQSVPEFEPNEVQNDIPEDTYNDVLSGSVDEEEPEEQRHPGERDVSPYPATTRRIQGRTQTESSRPEPARPRKSSLLPRGEKKRRFF
jgi:hypothetical protein